MGSWVSASADTPTQVWSASNQTKMDAIRKKMQSIKGGTEGLYATIAGFEEATREASARADQADCDIRDLGKKIQNLEMGYDETNDKLTKASESLEEADKQFKEVESDVAALTRRIMLMEEEDKKSADNLCQTITKLAVTSKNADQILKGVKLVENTCLNNEVTVEELAEKKLKEIEDELETVGENMKQLEKSAEKALEREEKLVEKILSLQNKFKVTEARFEYGEMNI